MWRSRDMIEMKGSIVSGCVLSTQESEKKLKKKKKKRKKYVECHLETLPVLPLCRLDYQEYPSSSNVTSTTTDTNLPHLSNHSKSLDLYIRQLWNLRVRNYFVVYFQGYDKKTTTLDTIKKQQHSNTGTHRTSRGNTRTKTEKTSTKSRGG